ncbi:MAG: hypothetical protein JW866_06240 [Ignavibacteriales bacterium]|nr:hypothetical protein [Ignavibacteriales bacterium]
MDINQKINLALTIINSLVFIVMVVTLILQYNAYKQNQKSLNNSQSELRATILGTKLQLNSILLSQKLKELDLIDKNSSIESQSKYNNVLKEIEKIKNEIESIKNKL